MNSYFTKQYGKSLKCKRFPSPSSETDILEYAYNIVQTNEVGVEIIGTANVTDGKAYGYSPGLILHNYDTCAILLVNFTNGNKAQKATYALNDNINDILVSGNYCEIIPAWGNIGGLYPSWAWGIVLTSKNIANFIGVATVSKKLAVAQYSNGAWTKIM